MPSDEYVSIEIFSRQQKLCRALKKIWDEHKPPHGGALEPIQFQMGDFGIKFVPPRGKRKENPFRVLLLSKDSPIGSLEIQNWESVNVSQPKNVLELRIGGRLLDVVIRDEAQKPKERRNLKLVTGPHTQNKLVHIKLPELTEVSPVKEEPIDGSPVVRDIYSYSGPKRPDGKGFNRATLRNGAPKNIY